MGIIVLSHHQKLKNLTLPRFLSPTLTLSLLLLPLLPNLLSYTCSHPVLPFLLSVCLSLFQPLSSLPSDNQCPPSECFTSLPLFVHSSALTIDQCTSQHTQDGGVLSNPQSIPVCSDCISKAEVNTLLTKLESSIRATFNARLLALEKQVFGLAQSVHMLR